MIMLKNKINNNKGSISLFSIMVMCVVLPFLMFLFVDCYHIHYMQGKLQHITDNACASAIVTLNEDRLGDGKVAVDEEKAKLIINKILKSELKLDDELNPTDNSYFVYEKPIVHLKVYNDVPPEGYVIKTPKGEVEIKNTSVLLYVDYPVHLAFFKNIKFNIGKISVNQAKL